MNQRLNGRAARLTLGGNRAVEWRVTDLCLYDALGQDAGAATNEAKLTDYMVAYLTMCDTNRNIYGNAMIDTVEMQPSVFEWPQGSGMIYYGVECVLTIREVI